MASSTSTMAEEPVGPEVVDTSPSVALTSSQLSFLEAASEGNLEELTHLLNRTGDVEEGDNIPAPSAFAASLLESATKEGDSALHLVAANVRTKACERFKRCAMLIHEKDNSLLSKKNSRGDTPLHCAARAGEPQLVSCLISLENDEGKLHELLRTSNNNNETALHEAILRGDNKMVKILLSADPELALFPKKGTSPLYLAILMIENMHVIRVWRWQRNLLGRNIGLERWQRNLLERNSIAQTLRDKSKNGLLSYLGPNGQNALHVAVLRGKEVTRLLLLWNKHLTKQKDENGSTPLHFAAGLEGALRPGSVCSQVFAANPDALFELDKNGLSPIHIAASVGAYQSVILFVGERPRSACLRDAKGRTFLHVAVEKKQVGVLFNSCKNGWLQPSIVNMQDNEGNTALHLAVESGSLQLFCALFGNREIRLNIANGKGKTPLDIAKHNVPPGLFKKLNSEAVILYELIQAGAGSGACRQDHFQESYKKNYGLKSEYESKELEKMKDLTQTQSIAAVLIATVAFGASFALPGGYRADDHTNGGTPTLAGSYAFDAFLMANTLAFTFATGTVLCLVRGGSPAFNRNSRRTYLRCASYFLEVSVTCFIAAFALGAFVVLSPVAHKTAIAICVIAPLIVICNKAELFLRKLLLLQSYWLRMGFASTLGGFIGLVLGHMFFDFWPFLLIFIWAALGKTTHQVEPLAPPPSV